MAKSVYDTLEQISLNLENDLVQFGLSFSRAPDAASRKQSFDFAKYLISVASHPVGLRASLKPFNSSQEHMLAYIMDVFSIERNKLLKLLVNNPTDQFQSEGNLLIDKAKRHSWRPELKIRLHPPTFSEQDDKMNRLHIRVYLFRDPQAAQHQSGQAEPEGNILEKIFRKWRLKQSVLIRPVAEMKRFVKFEPNESSSFKSVLPRYLYRMVQLTKEGEEVKDDLYLNIRRYYCEQNTLHILRLEFWLEADRGKIGIIRLIRNQVKKAFLGGQKYGESSMPVDERQEFYGYTNINLDQIPAYANRQTYPVLSLSGSVVNNCEIVLDFKNRRIENMNIVRAPQPKEVAARVSSKNFVVNHVRLYCYCLLYHSLQLNLKMSANFREESEVLQSLTLDNLIYIPAFTLINQHRLQSNLSRIEDLCLRRVAILILLMKMNRHSKLVAPIIVLLISVLQNEYQLSSKTIDEKTKQEMDPFKEEASLMDGPVFRLEASVLRAFVSNTLREGIKIWLKACSRAAKDFQQYTSLISLRLVKSAIVYYRKVDRGSKLKPRASFGHYLNIKVQKILCEMALIHLQAHFDRLSNIYTAGKTVDDQLETERIWTSLLKDTRYIDHDLSTYWSRKGLNSMIMKNIDLVNRLDPFRGLTDENLKTAIKAKIKAYVEI